MNNMNERIAVYRKAQVQNDYGALSQTRTLIAKLQASVRPMSGGERAMSDNTEAYATHRFHVHYRSDLRADDIIVWNGNDFNIRFVADNGPKERYMYIDAQRGGAM